MHSRGSKDPLECRLEQSDVVRLVDVEAPGTIGDDVAGNTETLGFASVQQRRVRAIVKVKLCLLYTSRCV